MSQNTSNPHPAPEIIEVGPDIDQVACDGGVGPLGHPMVYMTFDGSDRVTCGYCDREFIRRQKA